MSFYETMRALEGKVKEEVLTDLFEEAVKSIVLIEQKALDESSKTPILEELADFRESFIKTSSFTSAGEFSILLGSPNLIPLLQSFQEENERAKLLNLQQEGREATLVLHHKFLEIVRTNLPDLKETSDEDICDLEEFIEAAGRFA